MGSSSRSFLNPPTSQTALVSSIQSVRDLVERKLQRMEELEVAWESLNDQLTALAAERDHYAGLFQLAPDGFVVTDGNGTIRELNVAAQQLLRYPMPQLVGKALQLFVRMEDRIAFRANLNELLAGGASAPMSWTGAFNGGSRPKIDVRFSVGAIRLPDENFQLCWGLRPEK
jgi:PAS domain S-box-containing protein